MEKILTIVDNVAFEFFLCHVFDNAFIAHVVGTIELITAAKRQRLACNVINYKLVFREIPQRR
jgi:hypothetical protein